MPKRPNARKSKKAPAIRKTEYVAMGVWANPETGHIHLADGQEFISTVTNKPESIRCHAHLYGQLKRLLVASGRWPRGMP